MFSMKLPTKQYDCNIVEMAPHISALSLVLALESIPAFDVLLNLLFYYSILILELHGHMMYM